GEAFAGGLLQRPQPFCHCTGMVLVLTLESGKARERIDHQHAVVTRVNREGRVTYRRLQPRS
ncbi:MAG: hypothetical protein ABI651_02535, partial [Verrucomicrobiota bacterium]